MFSIRIFLLTVLIHLASSETISTLKNNVELEENCTPAAIYEFPSDGLTRKERQAGWIAIHVILTAYCFVALSIVCDDYFVPAIQRLVKRLQISEDVAGASFMAITSASPELFINCVGTFITEGDIGVGTVVGSNVFNILAAPACCGLFTKTAFTFHWYSIIRDGATYAISVIMLIVTLYDDQVQWYEGLMFVLAYFLYILAMYYDKNIHKALNNYLGKTELNNEKTYEMQQLNENKETQYNEKNNITKNTYVLESEEELQDFETLWAFPTNTKSTVRKIWWLHTWPLLFTMKYTIPNSKKYSNLFFLTLLMCMIWIGTISYLLAWLITAIGDTISIPDSVMGLSFLAVGSSMPEIVSCIIVSRQGQGVMGMSSALGANTFEILLCLGLPWLIKTCFYPKIKGSHWIDINSSGLAYNATCLFTTLIFLYICLFCNRFRLDWKVGLICLIMYGAFLVIGTLIELNFFFLVNLPTCA